MERIGAVRSLEWINDTKQKSPPSFIATGGFARDFRSILQKKSIISVLLSWFHPS